MIHINNNSFIPSGSPKKEGSDGSTVGCPEPPAVQVTHRSAPHAAIRRLLLMSYFPSGFWSRLITRILADDSVVDIVRNYFVMPREVTTSLHHHYLAFLHSLMCCSLLSDVKYLVFVTDAAYNFY